MDYVLVDFNERSRHPQVVHTTKLRLKDRFWFPWLPFRKAINVTYYRVAAQATPPEVLRLRDPADFVTLRKLMGDDGRSAELREFKLESPEFPLEVVLNPDTIADVLDESAAELVVKVVLVYEPKKGKPTSTKDLSIPLKLVPARSEPRLWIELDRSFVEGREHVRDPRVFLGTLHVENGTAVRYARPLSCTLYIPGDAPPLPSLVSFGPPADGAFVESAAGDRLLLRGVPPQRLVSIPLYADLTRVDNPADVEPVSALIHADHHQDAGTTVPLSPVEALFHVRRNQQKAVLGVTLAEIGQLRPLHPGSVGILEDSIRWSPGRPGWMECFSLRIGNDAVSGAGVVEIQDLAFSFHSSQPISWTPDGGFLVNRHSAAACPRQHRFASHVGSHQNFTVSFRHDQIAELPEEMAAVCCTVSFRYREAAEPAWVDWREFSTEIRFNLELDLGREWLAIDFGTSAIVVARGADGVGEVELVDLQAPLRALAPEREWGPEQVPEFGTPFVSSAVTLESGKALDSADRDQSLVRLAPIRKDLVGSAHPVPYVKALIGTAEVPDLARNLDTFEYALSPGSPLRNAKQHPIQTDALLRETYDRLLSDLVTPGLVGTHPRKLVFSVPNSFTPRHLEQLRNLITTRFPKFKSEYISFISESDAVACYYVANPRLNARRASGAAGDGEEYVLVYDMGAGTLDLTYLRIRYEGGEPREVTILGRMGRSTAGNYFDSLIAREIVARFPDRFRYEMFKMAVKGEAKAAQHWLKRVVRDEIKPRLDQNETFMLQQPDAGDGSPQFIVDGQALPVALAELRNSSGITEFVRESTEGILHHFFALFPATPGQPYQPGTVPLHTVVLSGRSVQLRLLRDAVVRRLAEWSGNADLAVVDNLKAQELKSAVVQGAIQYAALYRRQTSSAPLRLRNRNIQARYGLLYRNPQIPDEWMFKELLNPSTLPVKKEPVIHRGGMAVFEYDTDVHDADPGDPSPNVVNLSQTAVSWFVQSFSSDTARDANAGRWEYITRMASFETDQAIPGGRRAVPVQIRVNGENQMQFKLGRQEDDPVASMRMNLTDSSTFRAAMWPFLAGDE